VSDDEWVCDACGKEIEFEGRDGSPAIMLEIEEEEEMVVVCRHCIIECYKAFKKLTSVLDAITTKTGEMSVAIRDALKGFDVKKEGTS